MREKLAEGYQRAGRELANVHLPGTPSCDDVITHSSVYMYVLYVIIFTDIRIDILILVRAVEDNIASQPTEAPSLEATNENYNSWRDNTEFITADKSVHVLPDSLAPVFLVKT